MVLSSQPRLRRALILFILGVSACVVAPDADAQSSAPVISGLNPSSVGMGSGAITIIVTGSGFQSSSVVQANGTPLATTFESSTSLIAVIPASQLTVSMSLPISVLNPSPVNQVSNAVGFLVLSLTRPAIESISVTNGARGSTVNLTITGNHFIGAEVRLSGTGVTVSTLSVNVSTIAVSLAISADAPTGDRTVTVATPVGSTSSFQSSGGPVPFIVTTGGSWTPVAPLVTNRDYSTATLLMDGRVLITGGSGTGSQGPISTAEIFNPTRNSWSNTGSMQIQRSSHHATILPDGRVLVTGGSSGSTRSVETYDPQTGSWTATGFRNNDSVVGLQLLTNGKVLAVHSGGESELYNPATGIWANIAATNQSTSGELTLLSDGTVLVTRDTRAEIYDPVTSQWIVTGSMVANQGTGHWKVLLADGRVLLGAGITSARSTTFTRGTEIYDPANKTWKSTTAVGDGTITLLPNGRVFRAGVFDNFDPSSTAVEYDPSTELVDLVAPPSMRVWHTRATLLRDGRVLVAGGGATFNNFRRELGGLPLSPDRRSCAGCFSGCLNRHGNRYCRYHDYRNRIYAEFCSENRQYDSRQSFSRISETRRVCPALSSITRQFFSG